MTTSSTHTAHDYLVHCKWKLVRGTNKYTDPKTGQVFARSHAVIVQEGRDNERVKETDLKRELRIMREDQAMRDWDPHCERIDELYPIGSKYKKLKR